MASLHTTARCLPPDPQPRSIHVLTNGRIVIESLVSHGFPYVSFASSQPPTTTTDPSTLAASTLSFDGQSATPTIDTLPVDDFGPLPFPKYRASISRHLSHVGLLGILDLGYAAHLLFATSATCVAQVAGAPIYKVTAVDSLPIVSPPTRSMAQENYESSSLRHLLFYLNHHPLFFSCHLDLSRSIRLQSLSPAVASTAAQQQQQPNWDFVLNRGLLPRSLMDSTTSCSPYAFFVPVVAGHVSHSAPLPDLTLTLIARTNTLRLGRRYFSRGMNPSGGSGCSNAIESELIVSTTSSSRTHRVASHLQWRGSVPLVWSQVPSYDLKQWKPRPIVSALHAEGDWNPVERYLQAWTRLVPRVLFLDLLDRGNPGERVLSETLEQAVCELREATEPVANTRRRGTAPSWGWGAETDAHKQSPGTRCWPVEYLHFALANRTHAAVRAVEAKVASHDGVNQVSLVELGPMGAPVRRMTQSTVVRTNCLDSIDRTNLVQSQLSLLALPSLLTALARHAGANDLATLQCALRSMWITHGHDVARWYVGTQAVSQDLACPPPRQTSPTDTPWAWWHQPWIGIGVHNECILARRQYMQYFVDPALQDLCDEHLSPPTTLRVPMSAVPAAALDVAGQHHPHARQRLFALQRQISTDECDLPVAGFVFVFARKHFAPMNVDGVLGLMASVLWMAGAVMVQWWLGGAQSDAAKGVVRKPRRLVQVSRNLAPGLHETGGPRLGQASHISKHTRR